MAELFNAMVGAYETWAEPLSARLAQVAQKDHGEPWRLRARYRRRNGCFVTSGSRPRRERIALDLFPPWSLG